MNLIHTDLIFGAVTLVMMVVSFAANVAAVVVGLFIYDRWLRRRSS